MAKRKEVEIDKDEESLSNPDTAEESSSDDDNSVLDVEFEWFDPQPAHDFHGIKTLLRQLLDADAQLIDLSALTDLILAQPLLGSTVKVEGNETDPYAFLTVLNINQHLDKSVIRDLQRYLINQARSANSGSDVSEVLGSEKASVGLILTERLLNIPSEVVPPMYKMLLEEISWALEEKEPYDFTHFLILSKTYREVESRLEQEDGGTRKSKKQKKLGKSTGGETFYFHPEDEILLKNSVAHLDFEYVKGEAEGQSDSRRAFQELGVKPNGHMILIQAEKFEEAVKAMQHYFQQG